MDVLLSDDEGIFDGQGQTQHYQIGICSVEAMGVIGHEIIGIGSDELHNVVFSFSRCIGTCEDDAETFPVVIFFHFFFDEEVEHLVELIHEGGAWWDGIVFEIFLAVGHIGIAV